MDQIPQRSAMAVDAGNQQKRRHATGRQPGGDHVTEPHVPIRRRAEGDLAPGSGGRPGEEMPPAPSLAAAIAELERVLPVTGGKRQAAITEKLRRLRAVQAWRNEGPAP
ncbi:MAG: hypothetical protein IVW56_09510 [Candidatus Binataceae bacterium]|nr:hypothetical protein [Candidatus Binataceae bacterium]